ncbi:MAG: monovalent cation/H(+) antiporter subunit G [Spirochaetaceae bacterium]
MEIVPITGGIISILGAVFLLLASLGIIRMPDVYNRMQAGTKATTMGSILFLLGIALASPSWLGKVILLIVFIVFTNPISSHVLARAAHYRGVALSEKYSVRDCLADDEAGEEGVCE